jgi:two-component system, OmpR family, sensor kinase
MTAMRNRLSLRLRLTALYVALLAVLLIALGVAVYLDTRHFLLTSTAVRLRAQAKPIIDARRASIDLNSPRAQAYAPLPLTALIEEQESDAAKLARALTSRDTAAVIVDADGEYLGHGRMLAKEPAPVAPEKRYIARALAGETEVDYIAARDGKRSLVILIPIRRSHDDPHIIGVAQLNTPLAPVDEILLDLSLVLGGGGALALALGTLGGLWLTGSALKPLKRMVAVCRRVAEGDLKQRIDLSDRQDEIGELAGAFDHMVARLEQVFAAQSRFIADAAHELRTPLTALGGVVEVLLRGPRDDPAVANRLLTGMHREVTRMTQLAEQLLDMTRIEAPDVLRYEDIDLQAFFDEFLRQARLLPYGRRIELQPGEPVSWPVDPAALKQVLFNLVTNAAEHTDEAGFIRIGWRVHDAHLDLCVEDNGEGIAPTDLPHIFEPFYRGDRSRSRRRGGTGLGLALVRGIVEAHGGTIYVQSTLGGGSEFRISLPRKAPPVR